MLQETHKDFLDKTPQVQGKKQAGIGGWNYVKFERPCTAGKQWSEEEA